MLLILGIAAMRGMGEGGCQRECSSQFGKVVSFLVAGDVSVAQDPVNGNWVALAQEVCGSGIYVVCQFLARASRKAGGPQDGRLVVREDVYCTAL
jgi:hypothetical protein